MSCRESLQARPARERAERQLWWQLAGLRCLVGIGVVLCALHGCSFESLDGLTGDGDAGSDGMATGDGGSC